MRNIPSAAERARWLAEVAEALDQATSLVKRMNEMRGLGHNSAELAHRIAMASQLTRALRLGSDRRMSREIPPQ